MSIEFTNPFALVLLVLIPASLFAAARSHSFGFKPGRAVLIAGLRALILLSLVFAIAGLRMRTSSRDLALIFLIDISSSVFPDEQQAALDFVNLEIERAGPRDFVGVIAFAREPSVELAPARKEALGDWRLTGISSNPPRDYTDIASALRLAVALVPESAVGRLVLLSDGRENLSNAALYTPRLQAEGFEVYTRPMKSISDQAAGRAEVAVRDVTAPEALAEGEGFELKVTVDSTRETDATLRLFRNDTPISERRVHLVPFGENQFLLRQRVDRKGFYAYRAEVEAPESDLFAQNNSSEALVTVEGPPKAIYVYGDPGPSNSIVRILKEGKIDFDMRTAGALPTTLAGFQDYDLLIIDNVPATLLTKEQMSMIRSYVHDLGGGFVMIGGDKSFGAGGYYKSPIEAVLPVSLDIRNKKHFPSLALVLVIDKSGSMSQTQAGRSKIELATDAASAAVEALSERDWAGVIAFDHEAQPVVKLAQVEDKRAITAALSEISAGGGTAMYPGLQMAYDWLLANDAQIRHIIVLSDGESAPGDFPGIARSIRDAGMTLSSVAVGETADFALMKMLADAGGGRYYATNNPESLSTIFTREAFLASRGSIIEEPFVPLLTHSTRATAGVDWGQAPQLFGYDGTAERESAQKEVRSPAITSLVSDKGDPIYAVWQYGLGRSAAFTSDAKPRWAARWMNWPGFGQFWTQMFRDLLRRESESGGSRIDSRVEFDDSRERSRIGRVSVETLTPQGEFKNNLRLRARVVAPDLASTEIALEQIAAGRYEGYFPAELRGAYLVNITEDGRAIAVTGAVKSYSPEFSISTPDTNLLERISRQTGGKLLVTGAAAEKAGVLPPPEDPARKAGQDGEINDLDLFDRRATKTLPREVWDKLLLFALLLLPMDVAVRRIHIRREELERLLKIAVVRTRAWALTILGLHGTANVGAEAGQASLIQLKASRSRVRLRGSHSEGGEALLDSRPRGDGTTGLLADGPSSEPAPGRPLGYERERAVADSLRQREPTARMGRTAADSIPRGQSEHLPLASRLLDARRKKRD